jgi:hypothetical protein
MYWNITHDGSVSKAFETVQEAKKAAILYMNAMQANGFIIGIQTIDSRDQVYFSSLENDHEQGE